jgi:hypothetical protein
VGGAGDGGVIGGVRNIYHSFTVGVLNPLSGSVDCLAVNAIWG